MKIGIIVGSTRPGRKAETVAKWVLGIANERRDAAYEIVDIAAFGLPLLDEPTPPSMGKYTKPHTLAWAAAIAPLDGFVFVTPEYNHSVPAALKNAIDFLYAEWNKKAAGFVGYGSAGGTRAVEHLRTILAELQVATVRAQVALSLSSDFEKYRDFTPSPHQAARLHTMLDQLTEWTRAMTSVRAPTGAAER
ncbi:MAG: NAD(P)H-dependent oxidoreductase [Polyangiaceae bacterium]